MFYEFNDMMNARIKRHFMPHPENAVWRNDGDSYFKRHIMTVTETGNRGGLTPGTRQT